MNVLIFDAGPTEGARIHQALRDRGVPVSIAADPMRLVALVKQQRTDLVLLCAAKVSSEVLGLAESLRVNHILEPSQIQLITQTTDEADLVQVFESSIDAVIPWGCDVELLAARIHGVTRVLERVERKVGAPPFQPGGGEAAELPMRMIFRSNAWKSAPDKLREITGQFLGQGATMSAMPFDQAPPIEKSAAIPLLNGAHGVQIRLAVGADNKSALALAGKMFGPDAKDLVDDMLGEVANVLMGAMKTHFAAENFAFTGGLPQAIAPREVMLPTTAFAHRHLFALDIGGSRMTIHLGMFSKAPLGMAVSELKEGMVIARDIVNDRGLLLLKGGTRLSTTMIHKLTDLLPPRLTVQVMAA